MNNNMKAYYNARVFNGTSFIHDSAVLVADDRISDVLDINKIPASAEKINLGNHFLAPAFIDIQVYGGNGHLFSNELSAEAIAATYDYCVGGGASHFLITLATNTIAVFLKGIEAVKEYWKEGGKGLLGLHLEGPYINPLKRGAHLENCIKKPTAEEVNLLLHHGKEVIKIMTLAPEQCDTSIIKLLMDNGVVISAGHSNATYEEATNAFNNGIPIATHLFNAMSPLSHRAPGLPGAIYNHPAVMSSIVPDGIHVDFAVLRISKKVMQERLFMITDAVAATNEGPYAHVFKGDRYTLPDGTLSGSALTMMKGVKNCITMAGVSLEEALRMASCYPAKAIGAEQEFGKIEKGYKAAMVVFDDSFTVKEVIS
jgi:N-acetylglucosamine-6-phosphate deacetylase